MGIPHHKIIETFLPDVFSLIRILRCAQEFTREPLFEDLHDRGRIALFGFTDEEVEVLGHDDIAHNDEVIFAADLFEGF